MEEEIDQNQNIENAFDRAPEGRWVNKKRTLVLSTRGTTERHRHLMLDLINLLPHAKKEVYSSSYEVQNREKRHQIADRRAL